VRRLVARYGADLVIVHGGDSGVDQSFSRACKSLGVAVEARVADWRQTAAPTVGSRNRELIKCGADLSIAVHKTNGASQRTGDCVLQAIQARIPAFLIEDERAIPRRIKAGDERLA